MKKIFKKSNISSFSTLKQDKPLSPEKLTQYLVDLDSDVFNLYRYVNDLPVIPYGSMYADESSITVAVAATNTYYSVSTSLLSGGCSADFTFQNTRELKSNKAGNFLVNWSMGVNCSTNNQDLSGGVMVNDTAKLNTTNHAFGGVGGGKDISLGGTGVLSLAKDDLVKLSVANHTATNNIVVEHLNLTIFMLNR